MIPYYFLLIIPLYMASIEYILWSNQELSLKKKRLNTSIIVFFVLWCILLSCRSISCGSDLKGYEYVFNTTATQSFSDLFRIHSIEQLYYVFNWIIAQISFSFRLYIIVIALLCTSIVGWFYWKESEFAPLTILLFITNACYGMFYSGLRQSIAMLFVIPAYYLVRKKKIIAFFLIVLTATYFHSSASIMFFLYPIFHTKLKSRNFFAVISFVVLFFLFKSQLFNAILPFLGDRYIERYGEIQETNGYAVWGLFILLLIFSFVALDEKKMNLDHLGLRNVMILMTLIQGFAPINAVAMRMNYYFILLFPIIVPKLMATAKQENENILKFSKWVMVIFFSVLYLFYVCNESRDGINIYPYTSYWEE